MNHIAIHLKDIHHRRKSGQLEFQARGGQKLLYFQDGGLIFTKTTDPDERLGAVLFKSGKISKETLDAIPSLLDPGRMIGETLLQKHLVSQKDVFEALQAQMWLIPLGLFSSFDADITFHETERFLDQDFEMKIPLPALIERGIREMPFHFELAEYLGPNVYAPSGRASTVALSEQEKAVLGRLDGIRSASALADMQPLDTAVFWKSLYLLFCLDLVEVRESRRVTRREPPKEAAEASARESKEASKPQEEELDADIQADLDEALELKRRLPEIDFYQVLGVAHTAGPEEVKKAYFRLARKFHPDRFGRILPPAVKGQVEDVFDYITKAYRTLSSKDHKSAYASKLSSAGQDDEKDRSKNAEIRFRQGKTLFQTARYEEAVSLLEEAVRLRDDKGDYYLLLAMAESKVADLSKRAERDFIKAIELEAWNPEGYVGLGCLYKKEGLQLRARKQFEKALEIDADHKGARQALEELEIKPEAKKGLKGILSKDLFGSKKK